MIGANGIKERGSCMTGCLFSFWRFPTDFLSNHKTSVQQCHNHSSHEIVAKRPLVGVEGSVLIPVLRELLPPQNKLFQLIHVLLRPVFLCLSLKTNDEKVK